VEEKPEPFCGEDDVIVRNVRSGICGSDVGAYLYGTMASGIFPGKEFGHEMTGVVYKTGKNITGIKNGLRVWVNPNTSVINRWDSDMAGAFSQYTVVHNAKLDYNLYPLPDDLSFDDAVLIEPFAVGTHGKNRAGCKKDTSVLIYGAGTIGLCVLNSLIAQGNKRVVVLDVSNDRLKIAEKMGAAVCNPLETNYKDFLFSTFGETKSNTPLIIKTGEGPTDIELVSGKAVNADVVIDCAGANNIAGDFMSFAKPNATLVCIAIHKKEIPVNFRQIMSTEANIIGSRGYTNADIYEVIENLRQKNTRITDIITHHFKLSGAKKAFETASDPGAAIKVVFDMETDE
jgi:threonine dehydrogenase-like Zn-dependent dehydrogenase